MVSRKILENTFHTVDRRTFWSSARRPFWPASHGGRVIHVSEFQPLLKEQKGKITVALRLIRDPANGLDRITYLGEKLLAGLTDPNLNRHLANYLYSVKLNNPIHPRFFAEALHVIASHGKALSPSLERVRLRMLGRERIARALDSGDVKLMDIGREFERFSQRPVQERLQILEKLGVLVLKSGASLPQVYPPKPVPGLDPRPPIEKVDPAPRQRKGKRPNDPAQLDFLAKLEPKKPT